MSVCMYVMHACNVCNVCIVYVMYVTHVLQACMFVMSLWCYVMLFLCYCYNFCYVILCHCHVMLWTDYRHVISIHGCTHETNVELVAGDRQWACLCRFWRPQWSQAMCSGTNFIVEPESAPIPNDGGAACCCWIWSFSDLTTFFWWSWVTPSTKDAWIVAYSAIFFILHNSPSCPFSWSSWKLKQAHYSWRSVSAFDGINFKYLYKLQLTRFRTVALW